MESINSRIRQVLEVKYSGNQVEFSKIFNSTPQYVSKLIKEGGSVGLEPITKLLNHFEDINARWLITGQGKMIEVDSVKEVTKSFHDRIRSLLSIEHYLPYMSKDELQQYKDATNNISKFDYSSEQLEKWKEFYESDRRK